MFTFSSSHVVSMLSLCDLPSNLSSKTYEDGVEVDDLFKSRICKCCTYNGSLVAVFFKMPKDVLRPRHVIGD